MATVNTNVDAWHHISNSWPVHYRGIPCQQFASDMDRYAELIAELAPPFVIEVGRAAGGTALFLADELAQANPSGRVLSIDPVLEDGQRDRLEHRHLELLQASSTDELAIRRALRLHLDAGGRRGIVLLDGNHASAQVDLELFVYARFADYLVVEDTIMRDLGEVYADGPHVALDRWLPNHPEWRPELEPVPTQHPGGYLRRRHMEATVANLLRCTVAHYRGNTFVAAGTILPEGHPHVIDAFFEPFEVPEVPAPAPRAKKSTRTTGRKATT